MVKNAYSVVMGNFVYPVIIATVLGLGSWTWAVSSDVVLLKERVKQQDALKLELKDVKKELTLVRVNVGKLQISALAAQRSLDRIIDHFARPAH